MRTSIEGFVISLTALIVALYVAAAPYIFDDYCKRGTEIVNVVRVDIPWGCPKEKP